MRVGRRIMRGPWDDCDTGGERLRRCLTAKQQACHGDRRPAPEAGTTAQRHRAPARRRPTHSNGAATHLAGAFTWHTTLLARLLALGQPCGKKRGIPRNRKVESAILFRLPAPGMTVLPPPHAMAAELAAAI